MLMPLTISLLNKKGGVGKTSTCHHLAGSFAKSGRRVLLIDNDPQASLTQGLYGSQAAAEFSAAQSLAALYDDALFTDPANLIQPTAFECIFLVPGSDYLTRYNLPDPQNSGMLQVTLRDFLRDVGQDFDVVLIDCPPNLQMCSWSALVASDFVLVPLQAEDYGAQGITSVSHAVTAVQEGPNTSLNLLGYLITMYSKRLSIHIAYEDMLRKMYQDAVFTTNVPLSTHYKEAIVKRAPINYYKPRSEAAKVMDRLAAEILHRASEPLTHPARRIA
jgi:chromosome partitioning protein